jgi:hypothetical protein
MRVRAPQGLAWLLGVPGASAVVLETAVPYSRASLTQLLGQACAVTCAVTCAVICAVTQSHPRPHARTVLLLQYLCNKPFAACLRCHVCARAHTYIHRLSLHANTTLHSPYCPTTPRGGVLQTPTQFCSQETAQTLARAALRRAAELTPDWGSPLLGLGASCALASEPPKRGEHRAYLAAAGPGGEHVAALTLCKGARSRWQEECLVGKLLLQARCRRNARLVLLLGVVPEALGAGVIPDNPTNPSAALCPPTIASSPTAPLLLRHTGLGACKRGGATPCTAADAW